MTRFHVLDADNSGRVSEGEILSALGASITVDDPDFARTRAALDTDGDGDIDPVDVGLWDESENAASLQLSTPTATADWMTHAAGFPGLSSSIKNAGITQDELLGTMLSTSNPGSSTSQQLRAVLSLGEDEFSVLKARMLRALVLRVGETPPSTQCP